MQAHAQGVAAPVPAAASEPAFTVQYQSPLKGYQGYKDTRPVPWPQANQTVQEIGGWKAYAKEASQAKHQHPMGQPHGGAR
jgi:hypothetical protein